MEAVFVLFGSGRDRVLSKRYVVPDKYDPLLNKNNPKLDEFHFILDIFLEKLDNFLEKLDIFHLKPPLYKVFSLDPSRN